MYRATSVTLNYVHFLLSTEKRDKFSRFNDPTIKTKLQHKQQNYMFFSIQVICTGNFTSHSIFVFNVHSMFVFFLPLTLHYLHCKFLPTITSHSMQNRKNFKPPIIFVFKYFHSFLYYGNLQYKKYFLQQGERCSIRNLQTGVHCILIVKRTEEIA